jgi:Skp family chaperone for outer membrane proteins
MDKGWRVALVFIGIFVAGALTGGLLALRFAQPSPAAPVVEVSQPAPTPTPEVAPPPSTPTTEPVPPAIKPTPAPDQTAVAATPPARPVAQPPPEPLGQQLFRKIANQLDLTSAQRAKIRPIEGRMVVELQRLRRDFGHSTQVLIDKAEDEIRALLTSDQQEKFDDFVTKQRDKIQKYNKEVQRKQAEQRQQMQRRAANPPAASPVTPADSAGEKK